MPFELPHLYVLYICYCSTFFLLLIDILFVTTLKELTENNFVLILTKRCQKARGSKKKILIFRRYKNQDNINQNKGKLAGNKNDRIRK